MVMTSFGAPDVQRAGVNTVRLSGVAELLPGDVLALALDAKGQATGNTAHHIQVVVQRDPVNIRIYQGNSDWHIHKPITWINKILGNNSADPDKDAYAGMTPEKGGYSLNGNSWDYKNYTTGGADRDFLKYFEFYRWNFEGFSG